MTIKIIQCTDIEVIERGILQVECPYCNEVFKALPSAFTPEDYRCSKCNKSMEIKFVAVSKEEPKLNERQKPAEIKQDHIGYYHEHDEPDGLGYMLRLRFAPTTGGWHSLDYRYCPICGKELIKPENL